MSLRSRAAWLRSFVAATLLLTVTGARPPLSHAASEEGASRPHLMSPAPGETAPEIPPIVALLPGGGACPSLLLAVDDDIVPSHVWYGSQTAILRPLAPLDPGRRVLRAICSPGLESSDPVTVWVEGEEKARAPVDPEAVRLDFSGRLGFRMVGANGRASAQLPLEITAGAGTATYGLNAHLKGTAPVSTFAEGVNVHGFRPESYRVEAEAPGIRLTAGVSSLDQFDPFLFGAGLIESTVLDVSAGGNGLALIRAARPDVAGVVWRGPHTFVSRSAAVWGEAYGGVGLGVESAQVAVGDWRHSAHVAVSGSYPGQPVGRAVRLQSWTDQGMWHMRTTWVDALFRTLNVRQERGLEIAAVRSGPLMLSGKYVRSLSGFQKWSVVATGSGPYLDVWEAGASGSINERATVAPYLSGAWQKMYGGWNLQAEGEWDGPEITLDGPSGNLAAEVKLSASRRWGKTRMVGKVWAKDNRDAGILQRETGGEINLTRAVGDGLRLVGSVWSKRRLAAADGSAAYVHASNGIEASLLYRQGRHEIEALIRTERRVQIARASSLFSWKAAYAFVW